MPRIAASVYRRVYETANYRLRTVAGGRLARYCRPTFVIALLTERCNARCVHCDIWKNRGREESPSLEQWQVVQRDVRQWLGPVQMTLTGGEALLTPFTIDMVTSGTSLGLFMEILTHGYWPDQSKIERLARANPWRITVSLDGLGATHSRIRGREDFFERTSTTLHTLQRVRREEGLGYVILLKNVLMEHNLDQAGEIARFAHEGGMQVFYQPVEQNYNTPEDSRWFETSENFPRDPAKAVTVVERLIQLKRAGLPIANSYAQLQAMLPYFRDPDSLRVSTQAHSAHERQQSCAALTNVQIQSNGDVTNCTGQPPVGNIKTDSIRRIWESRPRAWEDGCCLQRRFTKSEKEVRLFPTRLSAILPSNEEQIRRGIEAVLQTRKRRIGVVGLSFKPGTDDLRESPMVRLVEALIGKGCDVQILDPNVSTARLMGANRRYIEEEIPHISSLLCDSVDTLLAHAEVLVIGNTSADAIAAIAHACPHHDVIDLTRAMSREHGSPGKEG